MKQVIFLRHAKSDWGNEQLKDIDRHLNERGYSDAYLLGQWFAENKAVPDLVLCSTALRAFSTAQIFARAMDLRPEAFRLEPAIYEASLGTLCSIIAKQSEQFRCILMVGHNPGFTEVCNELGDLYFDNIPTCGLVSIKFDSENWGSAAESKGKVEYYRFPKELRNKD